jgi:flagella basal body P-ring formation protein FlgA
VTVEGLSYDPASDRFAANLSISAEGMPTQVMRVAGRVVQMATAVVATRRLAPDDVIAPGDVRQVQMPARRLAGDAVHDAAAAIGQSARRAIALGQPIAAGDIGQPVMIAKGATVVLMMDTPGLSIAAQGLALGSGGRDDTIQVMNPLSRAVMEARVTGPGRATIAPGSTPIVAPKSASATPHSPEIAE